MTYHGIMQLNFSQSDTHEVNCWWHGQDCTQYQLFMILIVLHYMSNQGLISKFITVVRLILLPTTLIIPLPLPL